MKKHIALITILAMLFQFFIPISYVCAEDLGFSFGKGSWGTDQQGVRFSVFDTVNCETLSVLDVFSHDNYNTFQKRIFGNYRKTMVATGCKLQYLYQYSIVNGRSGAICDIPLIYDTAKWEHTGLPDNDPFAGYLSTVYTNSSGRVSAAMYSFKNIMKSANLAVLENYFFRPLGYYLIDDGGRTNLERFDESYVLVIEPVFYFVLNTQEDGDRVYDHGYFFYGTATEWAMYDELNSPRHENNLFWNLGDPNKHARGTIAQTMGSLTYKAAPAGIIPQGDIEILLNGEEYEEDGRIPDGADYLSIRSPGNKIPGSYSERTNRKIFEQYGVEVMKRKDFSNLTVDIVESNTDFRTGTQGMMSFKITSGGETAYLPSFADMQAGGDYYGIKLKLKTLPRSTGSGRYMPDMEIYCDGLPDNFDESGKFALPVKTLAFKQFTVPDTPGEWWFSLEVYNADSGKEYYTSNTGSRDNELNQYCYKVSFSESVTMQPAPVSANSLKPRDFTPPSFELSSVSMSQPQTSKTWSYYKAFSHLDHEGNAMIIMELKTETVDGTISEGYAPTSYGNIPLKYSGGTMYTRSGYGIGLDVTSNAKVIQGETTGYQSGVALLPEYNYTNCGVMLEDVGGVFRMVKNPDSMHFNDTLYSDYSRVHFTPIWYPDGEYEIAVFLFDNWTPVGQLWDCKSYIVTISGTIYDDWYITRY